MTRGIINETITKTVGVDGYNLVRQRACTECIRLFTAFYSEVMNDNI